MVIFYPSSSSCADVICVSPEAYTARVNEPDSFAAAVDTLASLSVSHSSPATAAAATKDFQTKSAFSLQCAAVSEAQSLSVCLSVLWGLIQCMSSFGCVMLMRFNTRARLRECVCLILRQIAYQ